MVNRRIKRTWHGWEDLEPRWVGGRGVRLSGAGGDHPMAVRQGVRRAPSAEARAIVQRMSGLGLSVTEIARLTGYRPSTLYRSFRQELSTAGLYKDLDVLESAYWQAVGGPEKDWRRADASMTRFWLGERRGWRARTAYDKPSQVSLDLDRLSDEELHELDRLLGRAGDEG